jgi:uncharacterized protein
MNVEPLTAKDITALTEFLASPDRPEGTLTFHEFQGFIFAIAAAPEIIPPSEWLPLIFNAQDARYASRDEAQAMLGRIMSLYNETNDAVLEPTGDMPAGCEFRDEVLSNLDEDAPVSQWSRGFAYGHGWLEELWNEYVPEALDEDFGATMMALSFFVSRELADAYLAEFAATDDSTPAPSLVEIAETFREVFPEALREYALVGRSIFEVHRAADADAREPVRSTKVGRNKPCPCGSGKKYKRCCGARVH